MAAWKTISRFFGRFIETVRAWSLSQWKVFLFEYGLFFQSAEALFVGALWIGAVSAGADMTLWVPLLSIGWLLGTISIVTANWESAKKYSVGGVMTLAMALTATYIFVAHRPSDGPAVNPETQRLVSAAQFEKAKELEDFLGGKDENDLRNVFDLNTILERNIGVQATRIRLLLAGHYNDFLYKSPMLFWAKEGYYTAGPNGVHVNNGPRDVLFIETTPQYENASKRLTEFLNSAVIPSPIKDALTDFKVVLGQYTDTMFRVLDEKAHEDDNYFLQNMDMSTKYYGVIQSTLATVVKPLKPAADKVLSAIAENWRINR